MEAVHAGVGGSALCRQRARMQTASMSELLVTRKSSTKDRKDYRSVLGRPPAAAVEGAACVVVVVQLSGDVLGDTDMASAAWRTRLLAKQ